MIIPVNYAQVNMKFTGTASPLGAQMTFGVHNNTDLTPTEIAEIAGDEYLASNIDSFMASGCGLVSILVKKGPNDTGAAVDHPYVVPGTNANAGGTPSAAILIAKHTDLGGRHGRGRMYMPGVPETAIDPGGSLVSGFVAPLSVLFEAWRTAMTVANLPWVLLHSDATAPTLIDQLVVQAKTATQRRRLRR